MPALGALVISLLSWPWLEACDSGPIPGLVGADAGPADPIEQGCHRRCAHRARSNRVRIIDLYPRSERTATLARILDGERLFHLTAPAQGTANPGDLPRWRSRR